MLISLSSFFVKHPRFFISSNTLIAIDVPSRELITSNDNARKMPLQILPTRVESNVSGRENFPAVIIVLVLLKKDSRGYIRGFKSATISSIEAPLEIASTAESPMTERIHSRNTSSSEFFFS